MQSLRSIFSGPQSGGRPQINTILLRERLAELDQHPDLEEAAVDAIRTHVLINDFDGANRVYPTVIAAATGVDVQPLLNAFLHGIQHGIFDLHWDIRCPECGSLTADYAHLKDTSHSEHCAMCVADYNVDFAANVEVSFSLNAELVPGRRQLNEDPGLAFFGENKPVTGLEIMHSPTFRNLFSHEVLSSREQLRIAAVTTVFTDIVGSTAMYENLGDAVAYNIVRDHFDILFDSIIKFNGTVVKTIGDAVMASFTSNTHALESVVDMLEHFRAYNDARHLDRQVHIKVGLHRGPAILVTLNDRLDYFGSTINRAARIQGHAGTNQILLSAEVFEDVKASRCLENLGLLTAEPVDVQMKGIDGAQQVHVLQLPM